MAQLWGARTAGVVRTDLYLPQVAGTNRSPLDRQRARTIANLARVISERKVKTGIRRTLWAQAQRLERLAKTRLESFNGED